MVQRGGSEMNIREVGQKNESVTGLRPQKKCVRRIAQTYVSEVWIRGVWPEGSVSQALQRKTCPKNG